MEKSASAKKPRRHTLVELNRGTKSMRLSLHSHHPAVFLLTCGWLGHLPVVGKNNHLGALGVSLVTPFLMWPLARDGNIPAILLIVAVTTFLGTWALMHVKKREVESDHDSRAIVLDEFAGAALLSCMLPLMFDTFHTVTLHNQAPIVLLTGVLFRLLDITKLWPVHVMDIHWHHPVSVMADDLAAAVQGMLLLAGLAFIVPMLLG
jgi:phosphatidylglycerophosphatase A